MRTEAKAESGSVASMLLIVLLSLALVGSLAFGFWSFFGRQDYKKNSDAKAAAAVEAAKAIQKTELQKEFDEQAKLPHKAYRGSVAYGTITFEYPKTWSAYIDEAASGQLINGFFHPDTVPGIQSKTAYALRMELIQQEYSQVVEQYSSQITEGTAKAVAYIPPKMQGVPNVQPGIRLDGTIAQDKQGIKVILKVRDKTLQISTESKDFAGDFTNRVLATLTFVP